MGYKTFANNELLTAADVNDYLMRQAVVRVANKIERSAIPLPQDGMVIYRTDVGLFEFAKGGTFYPVAGQLLAKFVRTTGTTVPTGTTAIPWDGEVFDPLGMHDNTVNPSRIKPEVSGWYRLRARTRVLPANGLGLRGAVGGNSIADSEFWSIGVTNGWNTPNMDAAVPVTFGPSGYIEIQAIIIGAATELPSAFTTVEVSFERPL